MVLADRNYALAYDFPARVSRRPSPKALLMALVLPRMNSAVVQRLPAGDRPRRLCAALKLAARVTNEKDAKQVHNHGLNLSRAWCMRGLMQMLTPGEDPRWQRFGELSGTICVRPEAAITGGDYVSTHWLISFALLAETGGTRERCRAGTGAHRRSARRHPDSGGDAKGGIVRRMVASGQPAETKHRAMIGDVGGMFNQVSERVGRELTTANSGTAK